MRLQVYGHHAGEPSANTMKLAGRAANDQLYNYTSFIDGSEEVPHFPKAAVRDLQNNDGFRNILVTL